MTKIQHGSEMPGIQQTFPYFRITADMPLLWQRVRPPKMLVSFMGQTGGWKSMLIKMLIDNQESATSSQAPHFLSPVTGSINDNIPTSGEVHLYSDSTTYLTATPILYADSEGLDGGENVPRGARCKQRDNFLPSTSRSSSSNDPNFGKKIRKVAHSSQRDIVWATTLRLRAPGVACGIFGGTGDYHVEVHGISIVRGSKSTGGPDNGNSSDAFRLMGGRC